MPDRKDITEREKEASEKLEESLEKGAGRDAREKPKGPEDAKKRLEGDDETPS